MLLLAGHAERVEKKVPSAATRWQANHCIGCNRAESETPRLYRSNCHDKRHDRIIHAVNLRLAIVGLHHFSHIEPVRGKTCDLKTIYALHSLPQIQIQLTSDDLAQVKFFLW